MVTVGSQAACIDHPAAKTFPHGHIRQVRYAM
jgi:hypothetical protein